MRLGYRDAIDGEPVDLILFNSCTVTAESEAKSRKIIRRLSKKYPKAEIIVMGCYATRSPEEAASLPGVREIVKDKSDLPELLARWGLKDIPSGISSFEGRHRAWVKVQDGCRQGCSYCIIPLVRPNLVSRPAAEVIDEISRLKDAGYAEIVLTGIHLGHYGLNSNLSSPFGRGAGGEGCTLKTANNSLLTINSNSASPKNLTDLLRQIIKIPGKFRVRLSSIEAVEATSELIDIMAENPHRICPHLHLPMQSGSDKILEKMRRRWPMRRFMERCEEIRHRLDMPAITTDVIVGFPGETEDDFAQTCRAAEEIGFSKIHVFRFSPRQGTDAAKMPNRVPQRIHQDWAATLNELGNKLADQYAEKLIGKNLQVLVEGCLPSSPALLSGTADRYVNVEVPYQVAIGSQPNISPSDLIGRLIKVPIDGNSARVSFHS